MLSQNAMRLGNVQQTGLWAASRQSFSARWAKQSRDAKEDTRDAQVPLADTSVGEGRLGASTISSPSILEFSEMGNCQSMQKSREERFPSHSGEESCSVSAATLPTKLTGLPPRLPSPPSQVAPVLGLRAIAAVHSSCRLAAAELTVLRPTLERQFCLPCVTT